jgi:hypothetical protein
VSLQLTNSAVAFFIDSDFISLVLNVLHRATIPVRVDLWLWLWLWLCM